MKQQTESHKVQEMESKMQEKDRINEYLEMRIKLLQTRIVHGDSRNNTDSFKRKAQRRRTWCGTGGDKLNMYQSYRDLSPIQEKSPPLLYNESKKADMMNSSTFH